MNTFNNMANRYTLYAAGLALSAFVIALLAVTLAAGQAQATTTDTTTIATSGDDNPITQQQGTPPRHATPEACPGEAGNSNTQAASVVDSGHYALFDVWWNPEEGELTNTVCPPSIETTTGRGGTVTITRSASSIDITAEPPTIIHIPNSAKVALTESKYPEANYKKLWEADDAENPDGDGDRMVWALPACPPAGNPSASDDELCLSYSAALLNSADWNGNIEFIVTHVHQVDIDKQDRRYVLVYDVPATGPVLRWYSSDQDTDTVKVAPGGYDRPMWFFPSRGAYEFQVYIRGNPNITKSDPISEDQSVTSDFREYIIHVGAEADLSATMSVTPQNPSPTNEATITVTASNAGPDAAPETKVDITLPDGLTYASHTTATGTYANGVWSIGEFANGASASLTIKALVDAGTLGETLTAKAEISATETVTTNSGSYDVPVPDKTPGNNKAMGVITVAGSAKVAPMFQVTRSVPANSAHGTLVGDPIFVRKPDSGNRLIFGLTGDGANNFTALSIFNSAQIAVANGANIQAGTTYSLVLTVSDGQNAAGSSDLSVDHTIGVLINPPSLALSASSHSLKKGEDVTLTATPSNLPQGHGALTYRWIETTPYTGRIHIVPHSHNHGPTMTDGKAGGAPGSSIIYHYGVEVSWTKNGVTYRIPSSNMVTITWSD